MTVGRNAGIPLRVGERSVAPVVGVEHEFRVLDAQRQLDFATLLPRLDVDGARVDPSDPNAYRCSWGGIVTADGPEAEVAIPPVELRPGWTTEVEWRTRIARDALVAMLPARLRIDGYSTHLNVETRDQDVVRSGRLFVRHFAPAMMLLLDQPTSPGLLVRPRPGRLEVGGEYCSGDQLRAAATFAAGAGLACANAARSRPARTFLPAPIRARVRPANVRAGWYVDRRAFGSDLYREGRHTRLHSRRGTCTAQAHLVDAWSGARDAIEPFTTSTELDLVDRVVSGSAPLPLEGAPTSSSALGPYDANVFERVVGAHARPGFRVEPVSIAWNAVVFALRGARDAVACIPRMSLGEFLDDLEAGRLDDQIRSFLAAPPGGRVLRNADDATSPGLFDALDSPAAIVPPEPVPGRPGLPGRGAGSPTGPRRNKRSRGGRPRPRWLVAAVGAGVVVIATGAIAFAARRGNSTSTPVAAAGTSTTVTTATTVVTVPTGTDLKIDLDSAGVHMAGTVCRDHGHIDLSGTISSQGFTATISGGVDLAVQPDNSATYTGSVRVVASGGGGEAGTVNVDISGHAKINRFDATRAEIEVLDGSGIGTATATAGGASLSLPLSGANATHSAFPATLGSFC